MDRKHLYAIVIVSLLVDCPAVAQWRAVATKVKSLKELYSVRKDASMTISKGYYFPAYTAYDTALEDGTKAFEIKKKLQADGIERNLKGKCFRKVFSQHIDVRMDTTQLFQRVYVQNVSSYTVYLHSRHDNKWYHKVFEIGYQGYQTPSFIRLDTWEEMISTTVKENPNVGRESLKLGAIDELLIIASPLDTNLRTELVFGELKIVDRITEESECHHPFFDRLFRRDGYSDTLLQKDALWHYAGTPILLSTEEQYRSELWDNYVSIKNSDFTVQDEKDLLTDLVRQTLDEYQFYEEKDLDKSDILRRFDEIVMSYKDTASVYRLAHQYSDFVRASMKDGHFYIEVPGINGFRERRKDAPVRLHEIEGKIQVAAIFDTLYKECLQLGTEVIAVDHRPIHNIIDSLQTSLYGTAERRRSRVVATLLQKNAGDSTVLTIVNPTTHSQQKCVVKYNGKFAIPERFRPKHCEFKLLEEHVAYFRINFWDEDVFIRFLNHWKEICSSRGLIIDVRGNSGGSSLAVQRLVSLFIDRPFVYHDVIPSYRSDLRQSLMISPNARFHFPNNLFVTILGDENTACASEEFIAAMRRLENCYFISPSRTCGALAARHGIGFPSGVFVSIDALSNKIYTRDIGTVEHKGIEPDIWVLREKVSDLAPYDDKLLKVATKVLATKSW